MANGVTARSVLTMESAAHILYYHLLMSQLSNTRILPIPPIDTQRHSLLPSRPQIWSKHIHQPIQSRPHNTDHLHLVPIAMSATILYRPTRVGITVTSAIMVI